MGGRQEEGKEFGEGGVNFPRGQAVLRIFRNGEYHVIDGIFVVCWRKGEEPPSGVSAIGNGLDGASDVVGAIHIPHLQGEVEDDEGLHVRGVHSYDKGGVLRADSDIHVCLGEVDLREEG